LKRIYLSLGSNVGDRERNLRKALERLASDDVRVLRSSRIYETEPVGYTDQAWFLNLVVEAETTLFPMQLLTRIGRVEHELGRVRTVRTVRNGPRTIDIDILFYAAAIVNTLRLEIPHPRLAERRFVLAPLAELAPDLRHPVTHRSVRQMLESAPPAVVRPVAACSSTPHPFDAHGYQRKPDIARIHRRRP
jgi:2-amino-4-hydroxy-6-hydroxymethyldihydropteridine diphosphokinase